MVCSTRGMTSGGPDPAIEALRDLVARRLLAAGLTLQAEHRRDLSVGNPSPHNHPAPRGAFPRLRTGGGRANVAFEPTTVAGVRKVLRVRIGYRPAALHLLILANRGWKGIVDTLDRARGKVLAVLQGGSP